MFIPAEPAHGAPQTFGQHVRAARQAAGLSQMRLSALTDITQSTLSRIGRGRERCSPREVEALAAALGCTMADLKVLPSE